MAAYYNEIDPYAAQWLRNLISAGHITRGDVDERSVADVRPNDLRGYDQCHFFAGIGGWSLALHLAGWPNDRPVWTGSCPCQPFSSAGRQKGAADERHLWPAWFPLIAECRPPIVFGEQVAAAIGKGWLDAVFADLEGEGYACGATVLPACGVGAAHIRQRCWFVADADTTGSSEQWGGGLLDGEWAPQRDDADRRSADGDGDMANATEPGRGTQSQWPAGTNGRAPEELGRLRNAGGLADAGRIDLPSSAMEGRPSVVATEQSSKKHRGAGWADAEFIPCTDGKARPVEPGTFPLAHGIPGRVGRLRAYGNAIVPQVAAEFIKSVAD